MQQTAIVVSSALLKPSKRSPVEARSPFRSRPALENEELQSNLIIPMASPEESFVAIHAYPSGEPRSGVPGRGRGVRLRGESDGAAMGLVPGHLSHRGDLAGCCVGQPLQNVGEIVGWINSLAAATSQDRVDNGAAFSSLGMAHEQKILLSNCSRPDRILDQVIINLHFPVICKSAQRLPLVQSLTDREPV